MKHEITTLNTKKMLVASLKRFMEQKPLSKITITEIIADCGVNRKTFYYHFSDIYALVKWMLEQEAIDVVKQFDLLVDYKDAIIFVMDYVDNNKHIISCTYDSIGREELKRFFYNDFTGIIHMLIDGIETELSIAVSEDFKCFLCNLYTEALAGLLIDWAKNRDKNDKDKTLKYLFTVLHSSLPETLKAAHIDKL